MGWLAGCVPEFSDAGCDCRLCQRTILISSCSTDDSAVEGHETQHFATVAASAAGSRMFQLGLEAIAVVVRMCLIPPGRIEDHGWFADD
jgi:hypothetical protein